MERSKLFLAVAATLAAACETPTAPNARNLGEGPAPGFDAAPTSQTTFSGHATVVRARVDGLAEPITLVGTGELPESGGSLNKTLAELEIDEGQTAGILALNARVGHASAVGQGKRSRSQATVADLSLKVAGQPIEATFLEAAASAVCDAAGNAVGAASSTIADLTVAGQPITVTGEPNQVIDLPLIGLRIVLNEQDVKQSGNRTDVTVNALHITASEPVTGKKVDVIVAQAHADITCGVCTDQGDDFTTGGGWFNPGDPPRMRKHFAVAGGYKNGAWWGHLTYMDKAEGIQVKGDEVYSYANTKTPEGNRSVIKGRGHLRDGSLVDYEVTVEDNGEPGRSDTFYIVLKGVPSHPAYAAGGTLGGGNIQFHDKPSRCPVN